MSDTKPGKVLRVDTATWKYLQENKRPKERNATAVRRLIGLPPKKKEYEVPQQLYVLPESRIVCSSLAEARGEAIIRAVKKGKKKPTEKPLAVRIVSG